MPSSSTKVGDIVDAYCRRCKLVLDATVAAMVDDAIISVVCRTCGERQRHKPEKPTASTRGRRVVEVRSSRPSRPRSRRDTPARPLPHSDPLPEAEARRSGQRKKRVTDKVEDAQFLRWFKATNGVHSRYARPHRAEESYAEADLVLHKVHGMGIVEAVDPSSGAIKVLFREGLVTLDATPAAARS